jgi:hypothetical protein
MGYSNHIQNGSHDCHGPTTAWGLNAEPANWVNDTPSEQSEGRSDIKGGKQLVHPGPHRGDPACSNFSSESWPGGFLHAPPCGVASSCLGLPTRDYSGMSLETTWPGFGSRINPYLVLWRGTCPRRLSAMNGDPGSTQILTWHCGVMPQTVRPLTN